jgi:hypothetical protein
METAMTPIEMRGPEARQLSVWLVTGRADEAHAVLNELNACRARIDLPPFAMPDPPCLPSHGLITCPAIVELEAKQIGDGRWQVAA